jgi:hypothetical protein
MTTGPLHEHDCPGCAFLGTLDGRDLYACVGPTGFGSVIARASSDGPDYSSAPVGADYPYTGPLAEALGRAAAANLLPHLFPAPRRCFTGGCPGRVVADDADFCPDCEAAHAEPGWLDRTLGALLSD